MDFKQWREEEDPTTRAAFRFRQAMSALGEGMKFAHKEGLSEEEQAVMMQKVAKKE